MTEREAKTAIANIAFDSIIKLANVHEKLKAIDEELTICAEKGIHVAFSRALVKEALDITRQEKQCKNQAK